MIAINMITKNKDIISLYDHEIKGIKHIDDIVIIIEKIGHYKVIYKKGISIRYFKNFVKIG